MGKLEQAGMAAVLSYLLCLFPVYAAEPFKDFTFRMVKPPKPGETRRINIQVSEPELPTEVIPVSLTSAVANDRQDWFWEAISPSLDAAAPGRFQTAALKIAASPEAARITTPRVQALQSVAEDFGREILLATIGKKISPALILAMIGTESSGKTDAQSPAGAMGLMQLMPDTAIRFGVTDATDPAQNIRGGVAYLEWLLDKFNGDPILALAAYNAGENAVLKNGGVPAFSETRTYVPKVVAAFQVARALCLTPPELYSDGCVFQLKGQ